MLLDLNKLINTGIEIKLGDKKATIKQPTVKIIKKTDNLIKEMTDKNAYENRFEITKILLNNNVEGIKFTDEEIQSIPVKLQTQIHEEINSFIYDLENNPN